jgi:hypothetical protein
VIRLWILAGSLLVLAAPGHAADYSTTFPLTETPISEGGRWISAGAVGLNWKDVSTTTNLAHGTQTGSHGYDDSVAILTGAWGPAQTVTGTIRSDHPLGGNVFEEVELFVRAKIAPHSVRGYEINFRAINSPTQSYCEVVRWNGKLGDFTYVGKRSGTQCGVKTGDIVKATALGTTITVYINNVKIFSVADSTWSDGSPGLGFFLKGAPGVNGDYGFTAYTASDERAASQASSQALEAIDSPGHRRFLAVPVAGQPRMKRSHH